MTGLYCATCKKITDCRAKKPQCSTCGSLLTRLDQVLDVDLTEAQAEALAEEAIRATAAKTRAVLEMIRRLEEAAERTKADRVSAKMN